MNLGSYPDRVVDEAIRAMEKGRNPKDVADELRLKYGYDGLHWKTVKRWHVKYPAGKQPQSLPFQFKDEVLELVRAVTSQERQPTTPLQEEARKMCQQGDHSWLSDRRFEGHAYTTDDPSELLGESDSIQYRAKCYFCRYSEVVMDEEYWRIMNQIIHS